MMSIILDGARMTDRAAAHDYLKKALSLPDYYGANLDALYDCLGELPKGVQICLINEARIRENLGDYGEKLIDTFRDAADQVAAFTLQEQEDS